MSGNERQQLYKQAAKLRKSSMGSAARGRTVLHAGREYADADEEGPSFEKLSRGSADSLDDWVLRLISEAPELPAVHAEADENASLCDGLISAVVAGGCTVIAGERQIECLLRPEIVISQQSDLAVGDRVRFSERSDGEAVVEEVLPRKTRLSRPDPFYRHVERVIAANIDAVVIVAAVKAPPLHPRLIDRYLIAIERGGAEPIICVNKIDLLAPDEAAAEREKLCPYEELGIRVLACSAGEGRGTADLLAALTGKLCVFVGHS